MISDTRRETSLPIIQEKITPDSVVYADCYGVFGILDDSEFHHFRINHEDIFAKRIHNYINGIENFRNQAIQPLRACSSPEINDAFWTYDAPALA